MPSPGRGGNHWSSRGSGRSSTVVPFRASPASPVAALPAGRQATAATNGRHRGCPSKPISVGRASVVSFPGRASPGNRGRPVSTFTSLPSMSATECPSGSRSRLPPGASRVRVRCAAGSAASRAATSSAATFSAPAAPISTMGSSLSMGTAKQRSPVTGAGDSAGRMSIPAGMCSTTQPSSVLAGILAKASCHSGAGALHPAMLGACPGVKRHQPFPELVPSCWAKSVPPGAISTAPSGASTSIFQASAIRRAAQGRPRRSSPAPAITSRTQEVPLCRSESSASPRRSQNAEEYVPAPGGAPITRVTTSSSSTTAWATSVRVARSGASSLDDRRSRTPPTSSTKGRPAHSCWPVPPS